MKSRKLKSHKRRIKGIHRSRKGGLSLFSRRGKVKLSNRTKSLKKMFGNKKIVLMPVMPEDELDKKILPTTRDKPLYTQKKQPKLSNRTRSFRRMIELMNRGTSKKPIKRNEVVPYENNLDEVSSDDIDTNNEISQNTSITKDSDEIDIDRGINTEASTPLTGDEIDIDRGINTDEIDFDTDEIDFDV